MNMKNLSRVRESISIFEKPCQFCQQQALYSHQHIRMYRQQFNLNPINIKSHVIQRESNFQQTLLGVSF